MTLEEQIIIADTKAQDTAGRFVAAANDAEKRKALAAQYREELAALNALNAARESK